MTTRGGSRFSYLLTGLGLGAIGGILAAILARKETREAFRERRAKSLDYLKQQAGKLCETADAIVQQGKNLLAGNGSGLVDRSTEAEKQAYREEQRENLGG